MKPYICPVCNGHGIVPGGFYYTCSNAPSTTACNLHEELQPCAACEQYSDCFESNCTLERILGTDGCENFVRDLRELRNKKAKMGGLNV